MGWGPSPSRAPSPTAGWGPRPPRSPNPPRGPKRRPLPRFGASAAGQGHPEPPPCATAVPEPDTRGGRSQAANPAQVTKSCSFYCGSGSILASRGCGPSSAPRGMGLRRGNTLGSSPGAACPPPGEATGQRGDPRVPSRGAEPEAPGTADPPGGFLRRGEKSGPGGGVGVPPPVPAPVSGGGERGRAPQGCSQARRCPSARAMPSMMPAPSRNPAFCRRKRLQVPSPGPSEPRSASGSWGRAGGGSAESP